MASIHRAGKVTLIAAVLCLVNASDARAAWLTSFVGSSVFTGGSFITGYVNYAVYRNTFPDSPIDWRTLVPGGAGSVVYTSPPSPSGPGGENYVYFYSVFGTGGSGLPPGATLTSLEVPQRFLTRTGYLTNTAFNDPQGNVVGSSSGGNQLDAGVTPSLVGVTLQNGTTTPANPDFVLATMRSTFLIPLTAGGSALDLTTTVFFGTSNFAPDFENAVVRGTDSVGPASRTALAPTAAPEPGSLVLVGVALAGAATVRFRRRFKMSRSESPN